MKSVRLIFVLTTVLMLTRVKSQTLLVSTRFLNSDNIGVLVDYKLNCEGKTVYSGQSVEKLELSLSLNKTYVLIVSDKNFKTEMRCFSIKPELNRDQYRFEFDVHLKEKNPLQNTSLKNEKVIEERYNTGIDYIPGNSLSPRQI